MLMLKAALLPRDQALDSYNQWIFELKTINHSSPKQTLSSLFDQLDMGSQRLLPLLYKNLKDELSEDSVLQSIKGYYKYCWAENQILSYQASETIKVFNSNEIGSLLLKGLPLSIQYYADFAVRPMSDFDLVVRKRDINLALKILADQGWKDTLTGSPFLKVDGLLTNGRNLTNDQNKELDIHWHVLKEIHTEELDKQFWDSKTAIKFGDTSTYTLSATDHLIHSIVHGLAWNVVPSIRWIPDSVYLMRNSEINWDQLFEKITRCKVSEFLVNAIPYLSNNFNVNVPDYAIQRLKNFEVSKREKLYFE